MGRVFKTRVFGKWMRKTGMPDDALCAAVVEMERGLIDADLGGGIVKKRVALPGRGKRGSTRTLVATNKANRWFFVFGFEKNERANISSKELETLRHLADDLLSLSPDKIAKGLACGALQEICNDNESKN